MRLPTGGPFLEFNFYWADVAEEEAFARLVAALLALGARFRRSDIANMEDLEQCLTDPHASLHQVYMEGATHDFYVSGSYIGREALTEVTALFAGAYIEPIADGVYVSCCEFLNPRGKGLTAGLDAKKIAVARYVAAAH